MTLNSHYDKSLKKIIIKNFYMVLVLLTNINSLNLYKKISSFWKKVSYIALKVNLLRTFIRLLI